MLALLVCPTNDQYGRDRPRSAKFCKCARLLRKLRVARRDDERVRVPECPAALPVPPLAGADVRPRPRGGMQQTSSSDGQQPRPEASETSGISAQLKDRLSLNGVVMVNGVADSGIRRPTDCPTVSSQGVAECSSGVHSEHSSGYSSSHEETRQKSAAEASDIRYVSYDSELQMQDIMRLIQKDLSEPYSIYTYRYFIHNWPKLCFLVHNSLLQ